VKPPPACRLDVFSASERQRYDALRATLAARRQGVEELPDGFALLFPGEPDLFRSLSEWIILESRCCPFLSFALELDAAPPAIRVRLRGGEDVKRFLRGAV
jgi:hypothetical protein